MSTETAETGVLDEVRDLPAPPRGEAPDYFAADLATLPARERIRRSLRQIANTEKTDREFARVIGSKASYVCNWFKSKCLPEPDTLAHIASVYNVNMQDIYDGTACTNNYKGQAAGGITATAVPRYGADSIISFPAGIVSELPEGTEAVSWVMGDASMAHMVPKGANLLIATTNEADDEKAPYLCELDGKLMVRKVTKYAAGFLLSPACDDPTIGEVLVTGSKLDSFKLIGKVVWYQVPTLISW